MVGSLHQLSHASRFSCISSPKTSFPAESPTLTLAHAADTQVSDKIEEASAASMNKVNELAEAAQARAGDIASNLQSALGCESSRRLSC